MRRTLIIIAFSVTSQLAIGQNFTDAIRYSEMETQGTARFNAMGGSFGALGGEVSGLSKNPGGIGVYRNSEFTISTGFNFYNARSNFQGVNKSDERLNFNIPNLSYIGSYKGDPNGWKNYSFGLTYNRIASFNEESRYSGNSISSSIIDDYVSILNDQSAPVANVEDFQYPYGPSEAWNILMIDTLTVTNSANNSRELTYVPFVFAQSNTEVESAQETSGSQSETAFSFGGNFQDKLFLGGSVGFQRVRFERATTYVENYSYEGVNINEADFFGTRYQEDYTLTTIGSGVNLKLGLIYRVNDNVRTGIAFHSPTYFGFSEEFVFESFSEFINGQSFESNETVGEYDYQLRTPARYLGSFAYLFGQVAAINFDYEYVDYSSAKFNDSRSSPFDFSTQNEFIDQELSSTHNVRVGAEVKEGPFVFRAGFRFNGNPYGDSFPFNLDGSRKTYSVGSGFRSKNFNFDIGYSTFGRTNTTQPLQTSNELVTYDEREHNLILTVGWKW